MPLLRLYPASTGTLNPSGHTNLLPGGAGVQVAGSTPVPGVSAPYIEANETEVYDVTAPSNIGSSGTVLPTPAAAGKYMVMSPITAAYGARWKLQGPTASPRIPSGTGGVVVSAAPTPQANQGTPEAGYCVSTAAGNEAAFGAKALIQTKGPCTAFVETLVGGSAISAGMYLTPDGAGNLTYAGASPNAGQVVGIYTGATIGSSVSIPVASNVYLGNF